jgi:hypothetical protein
MVAIKNKKLKFAILIGILLIVLSAVIFLLMRDPRKVKGIGKIEARIELSLNDLTTTNVPPKFYAMIDGQQYRLMPMLPTGESITFSEKDYLIEGFVPQLDQKINYYDQNNSDISIEILSEGNKIYKKICNVNPEYAKMETSEGLAKRLFFYLKDENNPSSKIMIAINIKPKDQ